MPTLWYARGHGARGAAARPSRRAGEAGARDRVRRAAADRRGGHREHARGLRGRDGRRVHPDLGIAGRLRAGGGDRRVPRRPGSAAPPRLDHPGGRADAVRPRQRGVDGLVRQPRRSADPVDRRRALARALPRELPRPRAAGPRRTSGAIPAGVWLDGIVAGLGFAALGAAVVFGPVLESATGSPSAVYTNLAYPVGDLLLAVLVVALLALRGWRLDRSWALLGRGFHAALRRRQHLPAERGQRRLPERPPREPLLHGRRRRCSPSPPGSATAGPCRLPWSGGRCCSCPWPSSRRRSASSSSTTSRR